MTTCLTRRFAGLLLVLPFVPAVADDLDDKEIARLVKQLGSSDFRARRAATKRLQEIGEPAAEALVGAMTSNDLETCRRAEAILTEIGKPALDALNKAATSKDVETRRRAELIVAVIENKLYPELVLTGHANQVCCVCVSADGKRVLTSSADKTLRLWDADTGKCLRVFEGHTEGVIGAALSPDGKRVLSGSDDGTVRLWDATTGKELLKMTGHTRPAWSVAFGPEGKAISGGSGGMCLWDLNTGKQAALFNFGGGAAYSAKAGLAATYTWDRIRLWDLETGKEVRSWTGHGNDGTRVCFSPDGTRLLTSGLGAEGALQIWDMKSGKELKQIKPGGWCAAFSADGKRIVSDGRRVAGANADTIYLVRLWDAATGKELRQYEGHAAHVSGVAFFPDGKRIASASWDGTARVWRAPR